MNTNKIKINNLTEVLTNLKNITIYQSSITIEKYLFVHGYTIHA